MHNKKFILPAIACFLLILVCATGCSKPDHLDPPNTVQRPGQLTITERRSNGFIVNWSASGEAITYHVYLSKDTNFTQPIVGYNPKTTASNSDSIYGLTRATKYYIKVQSVKAGSKGGYSVISATTNSEDVYVAGFQAFGQSLYQSHAKYWLNGISYDLENESTTWESQASDIFVSGNDVYTAGTTKGQYKDYRAVYWKNGKRVDMATSDGSSKAKAIFVAGNDVYVAGYSSEIYPFSATLWKNGKQIFIDPHPHTIANSLFVAGSDVHMIGIGLNDSADQVAKYWKNGAGMLLESGNQGWGNSVFVSGTDVYATGYHITTRFDLYSYSVAKCWKNGMELSFGNPQITSSGNGIYVDGNDIYVCGNLDGKPVYWKNGVAATLPGGKDCVTTGIYVLDKNVYVSGYEILQYATVARYWKNGIPVDLSPSLESSAMAMSIKVK